METASRAIIQDGLQYGLTMEDVELQALSRLFLLADINRGVSGDDSVEPHPSS